MIIIALCGKARSGKDTASNFIEDWYRTNTYDTNKIYKLALAEAIKKCVDTTGLTKEQARKAWQDYGREQREIHGQDYFVDLTLKKILEIGDPNGVYIITDVRLVEEAEAFKKARLPLKVIQIDSHLANRLERMKSDEDRENYLTKTSMDITETSFDCCPKTYYRDVIIHNNGSLTEFSARIDNYLYQDMMFGG